MTIRISRKTTTFGHPFVLSGSAEELSAGVYEVETEEEPIDSLSFPVYRRVSTWLHLPAKPVLMQRMIFDPNELEVALRRDLAPVG